MKSKKSCILIIILISLTLYGCSINLPQESASLPQQSEYPADMMGELYFTENINNFLGSVDNQIRPSTRPVSQDHIFAVVVITMRNRDYPDITRLEYGDWTLIDVSDDRQYAPIDTFKTINPDVHNIDIGETITLANCFMLPRNIAQSSPAFKLKFHWHNGQEYIDPPTYCDIAIKKTVPCYDLLNMRVLNVVPENIKPPEKIIVDNWQFTLLSSDWRGSQVSVKLRITNLTARRIFGDMFGGIQKLYAVDSTNKFIEPDKYGFLKEYYPNESWEGTLKFEMSEYSGETNLVFTQKYIENYVLFELGSP